jgi:hypothetical protein
MMPWGPMLQGLVNQAIKRSDHLLDRIEELESKRFTSHQAPKFLLDLLSRLNDQICKHLIKFAKNPPPKRFRAYRSRLREVNVWTHTIDFLYNFLGFVESTCIEINPPGIVSAIERIAGEIVPQTANILICPGHPCMYEYLNLLSEKYLRSKDYVPRVFNERVFKGVEIFAVFRYPLILRNDAMCHALLMHEVGHLLIEVNNNFLEVMSILPAQYPRETTLGALQDHFREYAADIVGVCVLGPAFLFAFIEFVTSVGRLTRQSTWQTHPPVMLRIRNILDSIQIYNQRFEAFTEMSEYARQAENFLKTLDNQINPEKISIEAISLEIFKYLHDALLSARDIIQGLIPDSLRFSPTPKLFNLYVDWVEKGIPPAARLQNGKAIPLTIGDILNSAWLYQISKLQIPQELPAPLRGSDYAANLIDISRLVQLAIKQAEDLHRFYGKAGL